MISFIKGTLFSVSEDSIIIDKDGIGYDLFMPKCDINDLPPVGAEVFVNTHLAVKEDDMTLYGFLSGETLSLFKMLLTVNSIGPKSALNILSELTVDELKAAIISKDAKAIAKANGIGQKGAEKIILELKNKIDLPYITQQDVLAASDNIADAKAGLAELGFSNADIRNALSKIEFSKDDSSEIIISKALGVL